MYRMCLLPECTACANCPDVLPACTTCLYCLTVLPYCTAEKAIPSGTQVLHTYGDLSDAQLLQTYGFIDITPQQQQQQQEEEEEGGDQHQQQQQRLSANPYNYVVLHTGELLACAKVVAAAAKIWPAKKAKQVG
jgi:hypothetical protein